jgi:hypothetical protein
LLASLVAWNKIFKPHNNSKRFSLSWLHAFAAAGLVKREQDGEEEESDPFSLQPTLEVREGVEGEEEEELEPARFAVPDDVVCQVFEMACGWVHVLYRLSSLCLPTAQLPIRPASDLAALAACCLRCFAPACSPHALRHASPQPAPRVTTVPLASLRSSGPSLIVASSRHQGVAWRVAATEYGLQAMEGL